MMVDRLKEAALELFAWRGYEGTSLTGVAGAVGIKKPSIYAHYGSKMDLFLSVAGWVSREYRQFWDRSLKEAEGMRGDEVPLFLFQRVVGFFSQDPARLAFFLRLWVFPPDDDPELESALDILRENNRRIVETVTGIVRRGVESRLFREVDPEAATHLIFCLLDGYLLRTLRPLEYVYTAELPRLLDLLMEGLRVPGERGGEAR